MEEQLVIALWVCVAITMFGKQLFGKSYIAKVGLGIERP